MVNLRNLCHLERNEGLLVLLSLSSKTLECTTQNLKRIFFNKCMQCSFASNLFNILAAHLDNPQICTYLNTLTLHHLCVCVFSPLFSWYLCLNIEVCVFPSQLVLMRPLCLEGYNFLYQFCLPQSFLIMVYHKKGQTPYLFMDHQSLILF